MNVSTKLASLKTSQFNKINNFSHFAKNVDGLPYRFLLNMASARNNENNDIRQDMFYTNFDTSTLL